MTEGRTMTKYWCVNFDSEDCLKYGLKHNLWMMQYQYADDHGNGFQSHKPSTISNNWQQLKNVSPGDLFVAYLKKNRYFAVGKVRTPRHDKSVSDVTTTVDKYLDAKRSHDHKNKCVFYADASVLYEDFTDKWRHPGDKLSKYAQRIDVEEWRCIVPEGIEMKGLLKYILKKPHLAVTKIDKTFFRRIEKQLKKPASSSFKTDLSSEVDEVREDAAVEALETSHAKSQGFQLDSKLRKALELYAMDLATAYFESMGYDVDDHSKKHPYDLHCARKDELLFVEVKGTQTKGDGVFLTHGEVGFARKHKDQMVLFVVHSIKVAKDGITLSDGTKLLVSPWNIDKGRLKPMSFDYQVPSGVRLD